MSNKKQSSRLEKYRAKRSAQHTPEPFGSTAHSRPRLFCVQKHAARRLHYDFRLEWGGTLLSWAVPRGPSPDPRANRLAVQVEDHPVDYADFEGIIPQGNYGAGTVILWDKGLWVPIDDPEQLAQTGKMHFELRGYKLRGEWILIRTGGKEWLLRKKKDAWASSDEQPFSEESILSGLTLEELRDGQDRARSVREGLRRLRAPQRDVDPFTVDLTLAESADEPFSHADWLFELKYDGYRVLAARHDGKPQLRSRNAKDLTDLFPEIARALGALPYDDLVLDGELVVLDDAGRPEFQRLQKRARNRRNFDVERAAVELPATFFAFDLLAFEGRDLRQLPLLQRKGLLQPLVPRTGPVRFADHVLERGEEMYDSVREMGLEGIIAKKTDSKYVARRTRQWLKIVVERTGDFVVCGYTAPRGNRAGFGALHLGVYVGKELRYAGRVGTGFNEAQLGEIREMLDSAVQKEPACTGAVPSARGNVWVRPEWVAEVRYKEITDEGLLRAPVFERMRDDKRPEECVGAVETEAASEVSAPQPQSVPKKEERRLQFSNLDKVFWPEEGYTKGDLIDYYRTVSDWLLPWLRNRPLVLTRYPDGIHGKSFYQKNAPEFVPRWIRRVRVWSGSSEREIEYFVCDDEDALLYIINLGAILLHIWPSRVDSIQNPDFCIVDLDPKEAPFAHVMKLARAIHKLCEEIELPSFVKTTGSTGLHVLLPLGGQCTFDQSRMLGQLLSRVIEAEYPDIATTIRNPEARGGRVYLDFLQNRHGQLLVAPYSTRPFPGAPVSAPLDWSEVNSRLTPRKFTIRNLPARLRRRENDPNRALLDLKPDLIGALEALAARLEAAS
jgi:bifunctional non-homologous end joining protein LigD